MELTIFEKATRQALRFEMPVGLVTVEDLWNLPLSAKEGRSNLDQLAQGLHRQLKAASDEVSFVDQAAAGAGNADLQLRFDVVKRIIDVRVDERNAARAEADRREKKQRIMELIAKKQDEKLSAASEEELRQMLETV